MLTKQSLLAVCCLTLLCSQTPGDDANDQNKAYVNGKDAGPAFAIQGEYTGTVKIGDSSVNIGVQVISEGMNKLVWVAYIGGLPGDGWDGNTPLRGTGEVEGEKGILNGEQGRGEIKDGSLVISTAENVRLGEIPKVVRISPTASRKPPKVAVILFDGTTADEFEGGKMDDEKSLLQGVTSHKKFGSFELHVEFLLPYMPNARGQGRANSGCYLQGRYEVQMLDSFGLTGEDNECGGIYEIRKPDTNMCFPPLSWQTYDIEYHTAKFGADGKKTGDAWMTVRHNGVVIHEKATLPRGTRAAPVGEGAEDGPIYLQNHGNPVRYRNIWVMPIAG
ncbi:MAG: DUF1080 domain-containing protein [Planctomycetota bacterium]|nr:DUF1080 domain-containing protein [Planctomycetota bacterium]